MSHKIQHILAILTKSFWLMPLSATNVFRGMMFVFRQEPMNMDRKLS